MKIKFLDSLALAVLLTGAAGCVSTPDGKHEAGWPFSRDTIPNRYEYPASKLADAARTVLTRQGKIIADDSVTGVIKAKINEHNVWVKVAQVDSKVSEIDVQARGSVSGDVLLAAEVSKQIGMELVAEQQH